MAANYWIKLYHEILDDPKMCRLPDRLYRRVIELFLLAGATDSDGELPPIEDMAWKLRLGAEELVEDLSNLEKTGIVTRLGPDSWMVTNFAKRQEPLKSTDRVREFRKRKRLYYGENDETIEPVGVMEIETQAQRSQNEDVTKRFTDTDIDKDTESDTEEKREAPATSAGAHANPVNGKKTHSSKSDDRIRHPAIVAFRAVTGRFPDKALFDRVIEVVGIHPDVPRMKRCYEAWVSRGKNRMSCEVWLFEWYATGNIAPYGRVTPANPGRTTSSPAVGGNARVMSEEERAEWWRKELERREYFRSRGMPFEEFTLDEPVEAKEESYAETG